MVVVAGAKPHQLKPCRRQDGQLVNQVRRLDARFFDCRALDRLDRKAYQAAAPERDGDAAAYSELRVLDPVVEQFGDRHVERNAHVTHQSGLRTGHRQQLGGASKSSISPIALKVKC